MYDQNQSSGSLVPDEVTKESIQDIANQFASPESLRKAVSSMSREDFVDRFSPDHPENGAYLYNSVLNDILDEKAALLDKSTSGIPEDPEESFNPGQYIAGDGAVVAQLSMVKQKISSNLGQYIAGDGAVVGLLAFTGLFLFLFLLLVVSNARKLYCTIKKKRQKQLDQQKTDQAAD